MFHINYELQIHVCIVLSAVFLEVTDHDFTPISKINFSIRVRSLLVYFQYIIFASDARVSYRYTKKTPCTTPLRRYRYWPECRQTFVDGFLFGVRARRYRRPRRRSGRSAGHAFFFLLLFVLVVFGTTAVIFPVARGRLLAFASFPWTKNTSRSKRLATTTTSYWPGTRGSKFISPKPDYRHRLLR